MLVNSTYKICLLNEFINKKDKSEQLLPVLENEGRISFQTPPRQSYPTEKGSVYSGEAPKAELAMSGSRFQHTLGKNFLAIRGV